MIAPAFNLLRGISGILRMLAAMLLLIGLSACEPSYSLAWSKEFDKPIQVLCISNALSSLSKNVSQGSYISDGDRGFPKGVRVIQFGYPDPHGDGHFDYDIGKIDASHTRIWHSFDKIGNRPSEQYLKKSAALLMRNNSVVAAKCRLEFTPEDSQKN